MRQERPDAIIGFPNQSHWDQFQADIRYLTHIGGHQTEVAVVFPPGRGADGICPRQQRDRMVERRPRLGQRFRPSRRSWSPPLIARMKELKLANGRIGVSGLSGLLRAPEGTVVVGMLEPVRQLSQCSI